MKSLILALLLVGAATPPATAASAAAKMPTITFHSFPKSPSFIAAAPAPPATSAVSPYFATLSSTSRSCAAPAFSGPQNIRAEESARRVEIRIGE